MHIDSISDEKLVYVLIYVDDLLTPSHEPFERVRGLERLLRTPKLVHHHVTFRRRLGTGAVAVVGDRNNNRVPRGRK